MLFVAVGALPSNVQSASAVATEIRNAEAAAGTVIVWEVVVFDEVVNTAPSGV